MYGAYRSTTFTHPITELHLVYTVYIWLYDNITIAPTTPHFHGNQPHHATDNTLQQ